MKHPLCLCLLLALSPVMAAAQATANTKSPVVFLQSGFPAIDTEVPSRAEFAQALPDARFADLAPLRSGEALVGAPLLVLPYGSAVPMAAWPAIQKYLSGGGNLLIIGGQPLRVPVSGEQQGTFQTHTYTTTIKEPGILICPTRLPHATLYVLTSEAPTQGVSFTDARSGKTFTGSLEAGHAALLLVGERGDLIANYRWHAQE